METEKLAEYFDCLMRLAERKCPRREDAEDLVSETILRALVFEKKGGVIAYPKTWLTNTMLHILNDALRKKYRGFVVTNLEDGFDVASEEDEYSHLFENDEEAQVRREVSYLSKLTREVIVMYYFGGFGVKYISDVLKVPEGTVKSRLDAGRKSVKKGMEMAVHTNENVIPAMLRYSWCGKDGYDSMRIVEDDLIAQNLLILAYDKPVNVTELSRMIGIPTAYVEPIVEKLVGAELMAKTDSGKYFTDFIIYMPEDTIGMFDKEKAFAAENFDGIWAEMEKMLSGIREMKPVGKMSEKARLKLERYALLRALQSYFSPERILKLEEITYPCRADGNSWLGVGFAYPPDYDRQAMNAINPYRILGGHRTIDNCYNRYTDSGEVYLVMHEFDVMMFDHCGKCSIGGYVNYCSGIHRLLWCTMKGVTPNEDDGVPTELVENIPEFIDIGYFVRENGKLKVDIPVLSGEEMQELNGIITSAVDSTASKYDGKAADFVRGTAIDIPTHLKSVPDALRYRRSTEVLPMAIIRLAYEKGLHLKDVDSCLPPVVLSYEYMN